MWINKRVKKQKNIFYQDNDQDDEVNIILKKEGEVYELVDEQKESFKVPEDMEPSRN